MLRNSTGHVAKFIGGSRRSGLIGYRDDFLSTTSDGTSPRPAKVGTGTQQHRKTRISLFFRLVIIARRTSAPGRSIVRKIACNPICQQGTILGICAKAGTAQIDSRQDSQEDQGFCKCVQYAISGVSRYRPVSGRTEPPGSSSSTRSCDMLPLRLADELNVGVLNGSVVFSGKAVFFRLPQLERRCSRTGGDTYSATRVGSQAFN